MFKKSRRPRFSRKLKIEWLESRRNPATIVWDGGGDQQSWEDPRNWDRDSLPNAEDHVVINLASAPQVIVQSNVTVDSLTTNGALSVYPQAQTGAISQFTVLNTLDAANGVFLVNSQLNRATITATTHVELFGAVINDVKLNGTMTLLQPSTVLSSLTIDGTLNLAGQTLQANGVTTIDGTGSLLFSTATNSPSRVVVEASSTLTLGATLKVDGTYGLIEGGALVNHATIVGREFTLRTNSLDNRGTFLAKNGRVIFDVPDWSGPYGSLRADGGTLLFSGTYQTPTNVVLSNDGRLELMGTIDNRGRQVSFSGQGTGWLNGVLVGGTIPVGVELHAAESGTLSEVVIDGTLLVDRTRIDIDRGITINGAIKVALGSIYVPDSATIIGTGVLELDFVASVLSRIEIGSDAVLTLGRDLTISSVYGEIFGGKLINNGTIEGSYLNLYPDALENYGTILARGNSTIIQVPDWAGPFGSLHADGGTLLFSGTYQTPTNVVLSNDGRMELMGTIDNRGRQVSLSGQGTAWLNGVLVGGTIPVGIELHAGESGTLSEVVIDGTLLVDQKRLVIDRGITIQGSIKVDSGSIYVPDSATIIGAGVLELDFVASVLSRIEIGPDAVLTLGRDLTISSLYGEIFGGKLINNGTIEGSYLNLYPDALENYGTILARGNSTIIQVPDWAGPFGSLHADGGTLSFSGTYQTPTNVALSNDGRMELMGTIDNRGRQVSFSGQGTAWLNGVLVGGTIPVGIELHAGESGTLSEVVIDGTLLVDHKRLVIDRGITIQGSIKVDSGSIYVPDSATMLGTGVLKLNYVASVLSRIEIGPDAVLTLGRDLTISSVFGEIFGGKLINNGTIEGTYLNLYPDALENYGSLFAHNGLLKIDVPNWAGPYGALIADGGALLLDGTYKVPQQLTLLNDGVLALNGIADNRDGDLTVLGDSSGLAQLSGKLIGGRVPAGLTLHAGNFSVLEDVVVDGEVLIENNISGVTIEKGLTVNGSINAVSGVLDIADSFTLQGTGKIVLDSLGSAGSLVRIAAGKALTIGTGVTVVSSFGQFEGGTLINQGVVEATRRLDFNNSITRNFGVLRSAGGIVRLDKVWENRGTFQTSSREVDSTELFGEIHSVGNSLNFATNKLTGGVWRLERGTSMHLFTEPVHNNSATIQLGAGATFAGLSELKLNDFGGVLELYPEAKLDLVGDFTNSGSLVFPVGEHSGQIVIAGHASLDGELAAPALEEFVASRGERFHVLEYASASGSFREINSRFFTYESDDGEAWLASKRAAADLATTQVIVPANTWTVDQVVTVTYEVMNRSTHSVNANWTDGLYLSKDQTLDAGDLLFGQSIFSGVLDAGHSYQRTWTGSLPGILPGSYYVLVAADIRASLSDPLRSNNVRVSESQNNVRMLTMSVGERQTLSVGANQTRYLQLTNQQLNDFRLMVRRLSGDGELQVTSRASVLPKPYSYDEKMVTTGNSAMLFVASREDGVHYLAFRNTGNETLSLDLESRYVGLEIHEFSPTTVANVGRVTFEIHGYQFEPGTRVVLTQGARTIVPASKSYSDSNLMRATFDLAGLPTGEYRLTVSNSDTTVQAEQRLTVTTGSLGKVKANLIIPDAVRANRTYDVTIEYSNESDADIEAPVFLLKGEGGHFVTNDDWPLASSTLVYGFHSTGNADTLPPRYKGAVSVQYSSSSPTNFELQQLDRNQPFPWDAFSNLEHSRISAADWQSKVAKFRADLNLTSNATFGETIRAIFGAIPVQGSLADSSGESPSRATANAQAGALLEPAIANSIKNRIGETNDGAIAGQKSLLLPGTPEWAAQQDEIRRYCPAEPLRQLNENELRELGKLSIPTRESIKQSHPELSFKSSSPSPLRYNVVWDETQQKYVAEKIDDPRDKFFHSYLREVKSASETTTDPSAEVFVLVHGWKGTVPDDRVEVLAKYLKYQRNQNGGSARVFIFDWTEGAVDEGLFTIFPGDPAQRTPFASDALNILLDRAQINPARTTLIGESFGAYVVNMAAQSSNVFYQQVIAFNPANQTPTFGTGSDARFDQGVINKVFFTLSFADHQAALTETYNGITVQLATPADYSPDYLHSVVGAHTFGMDWLLSRLMAGDSKWIDKSPSELLGEEPNHQGKAADGHILCSEVLPGPGTNDVGKWLLTVDLPEFFGVDLIQGFVRLVASFDPNEKVGTGGFGVQQFRQVSEGMSYRINFENDPKLASAPALDVTITDQLPPELDLQTLELVSVGFGDTVLPIPPGLKEYATTVATTNQDGSALMVRLAVTLDWSTRILRWSFQSIDPRTGHSPDSIYAGFLPVNDSTHRGEGFVSFRIRPNENLASGAVIQNKATIVFDDNQPIITNLTSHTMDSDAPNALISPLPLYTTDYSFVVSWNGNDGTSGVHSYDVFVSQDNGPNTKWLSSTSLTSGSFLGQEGSTYQFTVVAVDNVGISQGEPSVSNVTHVTKYPWHNAQRAEDVSKNGSVTAIDALLIINLLNQRFGPGFTTPLTIPEFLPDVNRDGFLTPLDALMVINVLNRGGTGEGEAPNPLEDPRSAIVDMIFSQIDDISMPSMEFHRRYFGMPTRSLSFLQRRSL